MAQRWFGWVVLLLLSVMGAVQVGSIRQESQTWDEAIHLSAGYSYLTTGDFRLNPEHPPLGKFLNALPLLFLGPTLPLSSPAWRDSAETEFGRAFLYDNRVPADTLLFAARCVTIAFTLSLGALLAFWTRARMGEPVALGALCFYVFDPNLIAHGRYVTSDLFLAAFVFLACISWMEWVKRPSGRRLVAAGLTLGLAFSSKMSSLFLPLAFVLIYLLWWRLQEQRGRWPAAFKRLVLGMSAVVFIGIAVLTLMYLPEYGRKLPLDTFFTGLSMQSDHLVVGHPSYLLGSISQTGWWYYFPVAMLVKTPVATLILFLAIGVALVRRMLPFECLAMLLTAGVYFASSMTSHLDIGVRHLLCIYPLLFVAGAYSVVAVASSLKGRLPAKVPAALCWILGIALALESLWVYPNYLAFFNIAAGGPGNGPRYLLDSNLDWGQDLRRLKAWADSHESTGMLIDYFGSAPPRYYGLSEDPLPTSGNHDDYLDISFAAVSATPLYGLYDDPARFALLRKMQPVAKIGYSIYVYDLRSFLPAEGVYDNTNRHVHYQGKWLVDRQFRDAMNGTLSYSDQPGASVSFKFDGTEMTYIYTTTFNRGIAELLVDGVTRNKVDLYSADTHWQARTRIAGFTPGNHEFTVRVTGEKNPQSKGVFVDLDALIPK